MGNGRAVQGHTLQGQGHAGAHVAGQKGDGANVHHQAAHVGGKLPRGDFPAGAGLHQHLLRALGVAALQGQHPHLVQGVPLGVVGNFRQLLDDVGLVVLHGDEHSLYL